MAIDLSTVSPTEVGTMGGHQIQVSGTFTGLRGQEFEVFLVPNAAPNPGFELGDASWSDRDAGVYVPIGSGGGWASAPGGGEEHSGATVAFHSALFAPSDLVSDHKEPAAEGVQFVAQGWLKLVGGVLTGSARVGIEWLDSLDAVLSSSLTAATALTGTYQRLGVTGVAPAGTVKARVVVIVIAHAADALLADDLFLGRIQNPCHSGRRGADGAAIVIREDRLTTYTPPVTAGTYTPFVRKKTDVTLNAWLVDALTVRKSCFQTTIYGLRKMFGPRYWVGRRSIEEEDPV